MAAPATSSPARTTAATAVSLLRGSGTSLCSPDPAAQRATRARRNGVVRPRDQRPRHRRGEAGTAGRVEGAESPEVFHEHCEELRSSNVRDERRVGVHAGDALTDGDREFGQTRQRFADVVAVLFQHRGHPIQAAPASVPTWLRCRAPMPTAAWPPSTCWPAGQRSLVAAPQGLRARIAELRISLLTCWLRSDRTPVTSPALLKRSVRFCVTAVEGSRQPGERVEGRPHLRRDLVERRRQRVQRLVQRRGVGSRSVVGRKSLTASVSE